MAGYLTTDANGEFSGTVSGLTAGNHIITATFEGDSEYNQSTTNKQFVVLDSTIVLSLTATAEIIQIGDIISITATLTKGGLPYVNQEITYAITDGSTIIDTDSDFTNNAGQITITYTGTGAGDINIIATYDSLTETLAIEDMVYIWDCLSDDGKWDWNSNMGRIYSVNGLTYYRSSGAGNICSKSTVTLPADFEVEFTYMGGVAYTSEINVGGMGMTHDVNGHQTWYYYRECGNQESGTVVTVQETLSSGDVFKITREDHVLKIYRNDDLKHTLTRSTDYNYIELVGYNNGRNTIIKDIKVKAI